MPPKETPKYKTTADPPPPHTKQLAVRAHAMDHTVDHMVYDTGGVRVLWYSMNVGEQRGALVCERDEVVARIGVKVPPPLVVHEARACERMVSAGLTALPLAHALSLATAVQLLQHNTARDAARSTQPNVQHATYCAAAVARPVWVLCRVACCCHAPYVSLTFCSQDFCCTACRFRRPFPFCVVLPFWPPNLQMDSVRGRKHLGASHSVHISLIVWYCTPAAGLPLFDTLSHGMASPCTKTLPGVAPAAG